MAAATYTLEASLLADGHRTIVYFDEVGRGSVAGPLVVAAVAVTAATDPNHPPFADSKLVPAGQRAELADAAKAWAAGWATGWVSAEHIDRYGITAGLRTAALDCLAQLDVINDAGTLAMFDGSHPFIWRTDVPATPRRAVEKLDLNSAACAAASLIAKDARDTHMAALEATHPGYGFDRHVGYGTVEHQAAIRELGLSAEHRATFCRRFIDDGTEQLTLL